MRRQTRERQIDLGKERERPFGADQNRHEIAGLGPDQIEIVAADASQHFGKARRDLVGFAAGDRAQCGRQAFARVRQRLAGLKYAVDRAHVVHHVAVADRARAAAVVGGHAADRRAAGRRWVDREKNAVLLQQTVQPVEHDAGLHARGHRFEVHALQRVEVLAAIENERIVDRLPALRGAAAARHQRHAHLRAELHRPHGRLRGFRNDDAERPDLIDRRVGAVEAARKVVESDFAFDLAAKPLGKRARCEAGCGRHLGRGEHLTRGRRRLREIRERRFDAAGRADVV